MPNFAQKTKVKNKELVEQTMTSPISKDAQKLQIVDIGVTDWLRIETKDILKVELVPWQLEELAVMVAKKLAKKSGSKPKTLIK